MSTGAILGLLLLTVCVAAILAMEGWRWKRAREGDAVLARGEWDRLEASVLPILKHVDPAGRRAAALYLRLAIASLGRGDEPAQVQTHFAKALEADPGTRYSDLEKLAARFRRAVPGGTYHHWREAELQYLGTLVASPKEVRLPGGRTLPGGIGTGSSAIQVQAHPMTGFLFFENQPHLELFEEALLTADLGRDRSGDTIRAAAVVHHFGGAQSGVTLSHQVLGDDGLDISILLTARQTQSWVSYHDHMHAFRNDHQAWIGLTDQALGSLVLSGRVRSELASEMACDAARVLVSMIRFSERRRMQDEIHQVTTKVKKVAAVYWLEQIGWAVNRFQYRTHWWHRAVCAEFALNVDFAGVVAAAGRLPSESDLVKGWRLTQDQFAFGLTSFSA